MKPYLLVAAMFAAISVACGGGASGSTVQQTTASPANTPSTAPSPSAATSGSPSAGLPPCKTATATNCDASGLQVAAGTRGSAGCVGRGPAMIGATPIHLSDLLYIQPMGLVTQGHVTPIDHGYFYTKGAMESPPRQTAVYSPLAGVITSVTRTARSGPNGAYDDYAVTIEATCSFRVRFSNMVDFAGGLAGAVGQLAPNQSADPQYKVSEGELIGHTGLPTAYGIDVWVENDDSTLTGFVNPTEYTQAEPWKTHVVDLFDYTKEPLKSQLLALDLRSASPRWGKIDYDIDGKLVGNWFRQGSGGYGGDPQNPNGYWDGHLSIAYDGNDPAQIFVSFGNYQGQPAQFAVIGNAPDPAAVSQSTGLVTYELGQIVTYNGDTGEVWDNKSYIPNIRVKASTPPEGTVLLQLLGDRLLKVEAFPGQTAAGVSGFDSGALLYER